MIIPVIILNYNSTDDTIRCCKSLFDQTGVETDIIIVDNKSKPSDIEKLRDFCESHSITLIEAQQNRGYNAGNNIGLRYCAEHGYQYALIANPDMQFPETDYIARLVSVMQSDPKIAVAGSDIIGLDNRHQNPMKRDGDWTSSFGWISGLLKRKKSDTYDFIDDYTRSHYCSKVSGCCLMVRLSTIKEMGYFDESVFLYCEEAILSRQIEHVGLKMYYTADTHAVHAHVKKSKGNPVTGFKRWRKSRLHYIDSHSGDGWLGRQIAKLLLNSYTALTIIAFKVRKLLSY